MRQVITYSLVILFGMGWIYAVVGFTATEAGGAAAPTHPPLALGEPAREATLALGEPAREAVTQEPPHLGLENWTVEECDELLATVRTLQLDREREGYSNGDPYQTWLTSSWAEGTTVEQRAQVRYMLDEVPIELRPGEAEWIIEREERDDWKLYGATRDVAFITFLGPQRVLAEASPEFLAELRADFDESEWSYVFGTPKPSK